MKAAWRQVGKVVHEANDLVAPLMHPWLLGQFPENDWRGDTPLEMAQLQEESMTFCQGMQ